MKTLSPRWLLLALVVACPCGLVARWPALDAQQAASPAGIPRTADGKPDFTGIYQWPTYLPGDERGRSSATVFDRKRFAPLKPGGEAFLEPRTGDPRHDEPRDFCMPAGFPGGMLSANAMQFFQTKNHLVMVHEFQRMSRVIPLDGRAHRKGIEPMFYGDPVGRWDGDTLIIETHQLQALGARRLLLHEPQGIPDAQRRAAHHRAAALEEPDRDLRTRSRSTTRRSSRSRGAQEFEILAKPEWDKDGLFEYVCEENNRCPGGKCGEKNRSGQSVGR